MMSRARAKSARKTRNSRCNLPISGFIRVNKVLAILGLGRTTFYNAVKEGYLPKPYKFGPKISLWSVEEIESVVDKIKAGTLQIRGKTGITKGRNRSAKSVKMTENRDKQDENGPVLLGITEAAEFCTLNLRIFGRLIQEGSIPDPIQVGSTYRWRKNDLMKWVAAGCPKNWNNR